MRVFVMGTVRLYLYRFKESVPFNFPLEDSRKRTEKDSDKKKEKKEGGGRERKVGK